ncbi:MAG: methionyl-tRNA formyltransferase [bacterium]|nr:methionyl-tRNA formyltransferase [bacterium]
MNTSINYAFMGTPLFAVHVLDELAQAHTFPTVVFCAPDKPIGRKKVLTAPPVKKWAHEHNIPVEQPRNKKELEDSLKKYTLDVSIVAAYNIIITASALAHPTYGTLNVHPSLLPRWRGPAPIQATILARDQEAGVCIMQLDEEIDHGPILTCEPIPLDVTETYVELQERLARLGGTLLSRILTPWVQGQYPGTNQDHAKATYSKKFSRTDAYVDLYKDQPEYIDAMVRALNPEPGTWTTVTTKKGEKDIKILSGKISKEGVYTPLCIIPEGKREMSWDDFARGNLYL